MNDDLFDADDVDFGKLYKAEDRSVVGLGFGRPFRPTAAYGAIEDGAPANRSALSGGIDFLSALVVIPRVLDHMNPAPRFGLRPAEQDRPRRLLFAWFDAL